MDPSFPTIPGHTVIASLGEGSCGEVLAVRGPAGEWRAVKFFKAMAVNRRLLMTAQARLAESGGHPGVVAWHAADFDARPYWVMMDFHGGHDEHAPQPWTLEDWLDQSLEPAMAWSIVRQIAEALAFLHRIGVGHCNLKPRNVLITDPEQGAVAVTDPAQGWVDGVYHFEPDDSLLYAGPEQLKEPEGLDHGAWGGWDAFAFGMLAFRLLTGRFAYGDAVRKRWESARRADAAHAHFSTSSVAETFKAKESPDWGKEAADWEEAERRRIIDGCLALDPETRYKDMREVQGEFVRIDEERTLRDERARVMGHRLREARALRLARTAAAVALASFVVALFAALVYAHRARRLADELAEIRGNLNRIVAEKDAEVRRREAEAAKREEQARAQAAGAVRETTAIKETLIRSQEQADRLFAVIRDRKPPTDPGFKDFTQEAAELRKFYEDFVQRVAGDPSMRLEHARAADHLADLAVSRDDPADATRWQREAVALWEDLLARDPRNVEWRRSLADASLKMSQLDFKAGRANEASATAGRARALLEDLAKEQPADDGVQQRLAAACLQQGRLERQRGKPEAALDLYLLATKRLSDLARRTGRLDYRSELAHGYVDMGELARGLDDLEKAVNVQRAVLDQLVAVVEEKPGLQMPRFDLARAYGELGEIEQEAGNPAKGGQLLEKSLEILKQLVAENPGSEDFLYQKARRLAALGRARRDEGKRADAETMVNEAVAILSKVVADHPPNPYYSYQLALAEWQQAELLSDLKKDREALQTMNVAMKRLEELLGREDVEPAQRRQIHVSMAYLIGDLAHRLDEAGQKADALAAFQNAAKRWKEAADTFGEDAATVDALNWCNRRIEELKTP